LAGKKKTYGTPKDDNGQSKLKGGEEKTGEITLIIRGTLESRMGRKRGQRFVAQKKMVSLNKKGKRHNRLHQAQ